MEQVVGIGGVFFKARDPKALAAWYREHLGVPVEPEQTYGAFTSAAAGEQAVWSAFPADTSYFGSGPAPFMVNYRVRNLDALLAQLRAAGAQVDDRVEVYDYGHAADGTFYYVMEYLPGLSLQDLIDRHGPMQPARAIHVLRQE